MNVNTNIAWIRRFVLRVVTAPADDAGAGSTSSPALIESSPVPEGGSSDRGAGEGAAPPWATEMAAPSFMIVSPRLPRR
ncbi:hypothetical protein [Streptomyces sp. NPDC096339]|uniref:hypothetical protein n=1 Tax=Streptomyces sp. NPDC096339 TaxID=3366086 RepID=UPI0037F4030F